MKSILRYDTRQNTAIANSSRANSSISHMPMESFSIRSVDRLMHIAAEELDGLSCKELPSVISIVACESKMRQVFTE